MKTMQQRMQIKEINIYYDIGLIWQIEKWSE